MASRRIASGTAITSRQRSQRRRDIKAKVSRIYFRADAGFANPEVYEFLEAERIKYAIRLPANRVLQGRIGRLLKRPVGRPPNEVRQFHANFSYQAGSWTKWTRLSCRMFAANQRGAAPASRTRLQPRHPAHAGDARADQGLVTDQLEREADQDRRKGGEGMAATSPSPLKKFKHKPKAELLLAQLCVGISGG
jgi:hypothetical protein